MTTTTWPQRPWLPPPPPRVTTIPPPPPLSVVSSVSSAAPAEQSPTQWAAAAVDEYRWQPCEWGDLPQHWSEELPLPPPSQRPIVVDDGGAASLTLGVTERDGQLVWSRQATLAQAHTTYDTLQMLRAERRRCQATGVGTDQPSYGLNAEANTTTTNGVVGRWSRALTLGALLVLVVLHLNNRQCDCTHWPGYRWGGAFTPALYAVSLWLLVVTVT